MEGATYKRFFHRPIGLGSSVRPSRYVLTVGKVAWFNLTQWPNLLTTRSTARNRHHSPSPTATNSSSCSHRKTTSNADYAAKFTWRSFTRRCERRPCCEPLRRRRCLSQRQLGRRQEPDVLSSPATHLVDELLGIVQLARLNRLDAPHQIHPTQRFRSDADTERRYQTAAIAFHPRGAAASRRNDDHFRLDRFGDLGGRFSHGAGDRMDAVGGKMRPPRDHATFRFPLPS